MKRIITSSIIASALIVGLTSVNSCSKVDDIIDNISIPVPFDIPFNSDITIPFAVTTESIRYPPIPLNLNLDEKIKAQFANASINNIKSAKLSSFTIDFVSSANSNAVKLDKVQDAKIYINAPNLPELEIASVINNLSPTALNFTPADKDLVNYMKSKDVSIVLELKGREAAATSEMKLKINSTFKLQVGF